MSSLLEEAPMPVGARVRGRLSGLGRSPAWLAKRVGVPRSTITRLLNAQRTPNTQTLQDVATALDIPLEELVRGTDAEDRISEVASRDVSRDHLDNAIKQMLSFERDVLDLRTRLREATELLASERERRTAAELKYVALEAECADARGRADRFEQDARAARIGLECAVKDVIRLKAEVETLAKTVDGGRRVTRVTAALAGIAAVASVAAYLARGVSEVEKPSGAKSAKRPRTEGR